MSPPVDPHQAIAAKLRRRLAAPATTRVQVVVEGGGPLDAEEHEAIATALRRITGTPVCLVID